MSLCAIKSVELGSAEDVTKSLIGFELPERVETLANGLQAAVSANWRDENWRPSGTCRRNSFSPEKAVPEWRNEKLLFTA